MQEQNGVGGGSEAREDERAVRTGCGEERKGEQCRQELPHPTIHQVSPEDVSPFVCLIVPLERTLLS